MDGIYHIRPAPVLANVTSTIKPTVAGNTAGGTGTYTLPVEITTALDDIYVIEFPFTISLSTDAPTCTSTPGGMVASCEYYFDSNSVFVKLSGDVTAITIANVNNPASALPPTNKLHFWAEH